MKKLLLLVTFFIFNAECMDNQNVRQRKIVAQIEKISNKKPTGINMTNDEKEIQRLTKEEKHLKDVEDKKEKCGCVELLAAMCQYYGKNC